IRIDNFRTGQRPYDIEIQGDIFYIALSYYGIMAFDISDPTNPERIAYLDTGGELDKIHLSDGLIYGGDGSAGIVILNPWFTSSDEITYDIPFEIKVFPNPATTTSIIEVAGNWDRPLIIKVATMDGRIVGSRVINVQNGNVTIPMDELMYKTSTQGIYFIVVSTGDKIKSIPIMWTL
ncbi:MAG: T9SS type A sorting domain-containing protein, partial [Saprospiraceae bacterium]|nr:T9SS type A sorting domain-containing protein [Saprospiraceae bacterium]